MNRRTARVFAVLPLLCALVHLIGICARDVPFDDDLFDAYQWKHYNGRRWMAKDLLDNHLHPGMTLKEVQALLGTNIALASYTKSLRVDRKDSVMFAVPANMKVVYSSPSSFGRQYYGSRAICYLGKNEWCTDYYYLYLYFDRTERYMGGVIEVDNRQ